MEQTQAWNEWSEQISGRHLPRWEELPDLALYLDQVLSLLDKYLAPYFTSESEHVMTASMINNYVKLHILPAPVKKRYNRVHLAYLIVIGMLKQVLSIPEIHALLESRGGAAQAESIYTHFCTVQEKAFSDTAQRAGECIARDETGPALAMEFAALAGASKSLAQKLLEP